MIFVAEKKWAARTVGLSFFNLPYATKTVLLAVLVSVLLLRRFAQEKFGQNHNSIMQNVHFRLMCVAQNVSQS